MTYHTQNNSILLWYQKVHKEKDDGDNNTSKADKVFAVLCYW